MPENNEFGTNCHYFIPIIEPPSIEEDALTFYNNLGLTVSSINNGQQGLAFTITSTNPNQVFSNLVPLDGNIFFVKQGTNFPSPLGILSNTIASTNTLCIQPSPISTMVLKQRFPYGIPPPELILIENIDEISFNLDLTLHINNIINGIDSWQNNRSSFNAQSLTKLINSYWKDSQGTDPILVLLNIKVLHFIDGIKNGSIRFSTRAGLKLGSFNKNSNNATEFSLKFFETGLIDYLSPISFLRSMELLPTENEGKIWTGHPIIQSISSFIVPLDIYLKFEIWNPLSVDDDSEPEYIPIDAGCEVKLMNYDVLLTSSQNELAVATSNANGQVIFNFSSLPTPTTTSPYPNLYFFILNPACTKINQFNLSNEPILLPNEWSTKADNSTDYWLSVDSTPGYLNNFKGFKLGNTDNPLTFRVGVDFHLKLEYLFTEKVTPFKKHVYPSIPLLKIDLRAFALIYKTVYTNNKGEVHTLLFNLKPKDELFFDILFETEDINNLNLKKTVINDSILHTQYVWRSKNNDESLIHYIDNVKTTLNDTSSEERNKPKRILFFNEITVTSFYVLKIIREIHSFLNYFTNGNWEGQEVTINLYHISEELTPTSFPVGLIWLTRKTKSYTRATIVHEYFHQIMWKVSDYSNVSIGLQFLWDGIKDHNFFHSPQSLSNTTRALTEGWSYAMESIFENKSLELDLIEFEEIESNIITGSLDPKNQIDLNKGFESEGAFGNCLYFIFWHLVINNQAVDQAIIESENGDISKSNSWMTDSAQSMISTSFLSLIWNPLIQLKTINIKTTSTLFSIIINSNPNIKHKLLGEMYRWNLMIENPIINSHVFALNGINATVTIFGENFIESRNNYSYNAVSLMKLLMNNNEIMYSIIDASELTFQIPNQPSGSSITIQIKIKIRNSYEISSNTKQIVFP